VRALRETGLRGAIPKLVDTQSLFRQEAVEERQRKLLGDVIITQPFHSYFISMLASAIVAFTIIWLSISEYARTTDVPGHTVSNLPSAKIVAQHAGQIEALYVREGDLVRAGQRLALVRTELTDEAGQSAATQNLNSLNEQRRILDSQIALLRQKSGLELDRVTSSIVSARNQRVELDRQIEIQAALVRSLQDMFDRVHTILREGFVSQFEVERRRQSLLSAQQQLSHLRQQRGVLQAEEQKLILERERVAPDTQSQIASTASNLEALEQQRVQATAQRAYMIKAPISGYVSALQTAAGRSVDPSIPLMVIIPENSTFRVESYAPSAAIGFLKPGQEVRLQYDAYPYQQYGTYRGTVTMISGVPISPGDLDASIKVSEASYRVEIKPDAQTVIAFGKRHSLRAGMTLTSTIVIDRRSLMAWLLQPVAAVAGRIQ
jgi:membrane fusion protein